MFKKSLLVSTIALMAATTAQADYQLEVSGTYARGELESSGGADGDQDTIALEGSVFLQPVDTSKGPLGEAAFIDRATSVSLGYGYSEVEFDSGSDFDLSLFNVSGRYVIHDGGWILEGGYDYDEIEADGGDSDSDSYTLRGGKYIADNTTLILGWTYSEDDGNRESDAYSVEMEHLQMLGQGALKIEGGYALVEANFTDDVDVYSVAGTYYVNNNLGFGGGYSLADGNNSEVDTWKLFSEWWMNEQVAFSVGYIGVEEEDANIESDSIVFSVTGRF